MLGCYLILSAASGGHELIIKTLLEHGADINAQTEDGRSLQTIAAGGGYHSLAEFIRDRRPEWWIY